MVLRLIPIKNHFIAGSAGRSAQIARSLARERELTRANYIFRSSGNGRKGRRCRAGGRAGPRATETGKRQRQRLEKKCAAAVATPSAITMP